METYQRYNPITREAGSCLAVARASVGIYLALCRSNLQKGTVIVPANLCYAGIYPVLYAGLQPAFCDVDPVSGNMTLSSLTAAYRTDAVAVIVPHMYGNPVQELPEIAEFCRIRNLVLIEDCASAMGATAEHYRLGEVGEYVVYSTGYSKTLDLGFGGFLFSSVHDLTDVMQLEQALPDYGEQNERDLTLFSKLYRLLRNEGSGTEIEKMIYRGLPDACKDDFLHRLADEKKDWLFRQLSGLDSVIAERKRALQDYEELLSGCVYGHYPYAVGSVPWRFNMLVDTPVRQRVIHRCLEESLPVSDWYPQVTRLFGVDSAFPGAKLHESRILNFPLLIDETTRQRICCVLREILAAGTAGGQRN